eukprot:12716109-Alexandrium_andersonii.AAC.1
MGHGRGLREVCFQLTGCAGLQPRRVERCWVTAWATAVGATAAAMQPVAARYVAGAAWLPAARCAHNWSGVLSLIHI